MALSWIKGLYTQAGKRFLTISLVIQEEERGWYLVRRVQGGNVPRSSCRRHAGLQVYRGGRSFKKKGRKPKRSHLVFFSWALHDRRYNNGGSLRTNLGVRPPKEPKKLWPKPVQITCGMN